MPVTKFGPWTARGACSKEKVASVALTDLSTKDVQKYPCLSVQFAELCKVTLHQERIFLDNYRNPEDRDNKTERKALSDRIPEGTSGGKIRSVSRAAMATPLAVHDQTWW